MATACIINVYNGTFDRGAKVTSVPREHVEVDEKLIEVGKTLSKWPSGTGPVVKVYDVAHIELELHNKIFSIKVGEEVLVEESEYYVGGGVYSRSSYCVKLIDSHIVYKGGWQWGDTILQKLEGPIGDGEVWYPNGDHFKGYFHLSYASINGPAYAAEGRYTFADGSWIEHAWINTSKDRKPEWWGLNGVFRVRRPVLHPDDSIAMFSHGKRFGFELFIPRESWQKPWVNEWYDGDKIIRYSGPDEVFRYEVDDYQIDDTSQKDCISLLLTLHDRNDVYKVEQQGGRYSANKYNNQIYEPSTKAAVYLPNGDSIGHNGTCVREMKPYDGYIYNHNAETGMYRREEWSDGKLKKAEEWKRDTSAAKRVEIPDPFGQGITSALVWKDGYIDYNSAEWIYEGEVVNNRPQGKGRLTGAKYFHEGESYVGGFHAGRCHGKGVYINEKAGISQDGEWMEGFFQEPKAPTGTIMLHAKYGHKHWSIGSDSEWKWEESDFEAKIGLLSFIGFGNVKIARIEQHCITLTRYERSELLTPGESVSFYAEIEGREWSDGCVYDGDDYQLLLSWAASKVG